jgi:uncharacterized protein
MKLHEKYKLALITGASSGIGRALAIKLANENISLILTGRNQLQLSQLASYLRSKVFVSFFSADLNNLNDLEKVKNQIQEHVPDLVINCAGIGFYGDSLTYTTQEQLKILDINCRGLTNITLDAARALKSKNKKGTILNVSSAASFFNFPSFSLYAASKAYVNHFSQSLDLELKKDGIRVLVACPGQVNTNFSKNANRSNHEKSIKFAMTQEDAAKAIIYQLKHDIPIYVFDWRNRLLIFMSKFIPQKILVRQLEKAIKKRILKRAFIPISIIENEKELANY